MPRFEYKVIPAPTRGLKAKGVKTTEERFANALQTAMNELGAEGWEYQRTDTLPCEEREGLLGKTTNFQNMLVFRRTIPDAAAPDPEIATTAETLTADETPALIEDQREPDPADTPRQAEADQDATAETDEKRGVAAE